MNIALTGSSGLIGLHLLQDLKNLNYNILRFDKEKNIQIHKNGGWHFNNIL